MTRVRRLTALVGLSFASACAGSAPPLIDASGSSPDGLSGVDDTRWVWVEAACADGELDLARLGFERELRVDVRGTSLQLTFDSELLADGCFHSMVWRAQPALDSEEWEIVPQAHVELPVEAACGAQEREPMRGSIRLGGDMLELVAHGSPWCRGFDARFVYRRATPGRLTPRQLVARYVAHFNRRDADELARLFADAGSLVEPFSSTDDGNLRRHEGRRQVRGWFEEAFASTGWLAMRLTGLSPVDSAGRVTADWEYMDARLGEPFRGRNLFVIAGGEIYESEVQLVDDPQARADAEATPAAPTEPTAPADPSVGGVADGDGEPASPVSSPGVDAGAAGAAAR